MRRKKEAAKKEELLLGEEPSGSFSPTVNGLSPPDGPSESVK
jgi:hypothetical protein